MPLQRKGSTQSLLQSRSDHRKTTNPQIVASLQIKQILQLHIRLLALSNFTQGSPHPALFPSAVLPNLPTHAACGLLLLRWPSAKNQDRPPWLTHDMFTAADKNPINIVTATARCSSSFRFGIHELSIAMYCRSS